MEAKLKRRKNARAALVRAALWACVLFTAGVFLLLVAYVLVRGVPHLRLSMFSPTYTTENLSMLPAILNTLTMTGVTLLIAVPLGVGAAIYLTEYAKPGNRLVPPIRLTTETLAGIPSIVYGLFGYLVFVKALHLRLSLLSGALTLAIMILPTIHYAYHGGGSAQHTPKLPGGQLWPGCRTAAHGVCNSAAYGAAGYSRRRPAVRRPHCG